LPAKDVPEEIYRRNCLLLGALLQHIHVSRVIVGHTPDTEDNKTRTYCDSKFIIIDVAMSRWMSDKGQPYALIMKFSPDGQRIESLTSHYDHPERYGLKMDESIPLN
jgi:hypothetical protein